jgi:hypothetical protein
MKSSNFLCILSFIIFSVAHAGDLPAQAPVPKKEALPVQKKNVEGRVSMKFDDDIVETTQDQLTLVRQKKDLKSSKLYSTEYKFRSHTKQLLNEIGDSR